MHNTLVLNDFKCLRVVLFTEPYLNPHKPDAERDKLAALAEAANITDFTAALDAALA